MGKYKEHSVFDEKDILNELPDIGYQDREIANIEKYEISKQLINMGFSKRQILDMFKFMS